MKTKLIEITLRHQSLISFMSVFGGPLAMILLVGFGGR